jgi:DNA-binding NtrC family response regulator
MPTKVLVLDPSASELDALVDRIERACGDESRVVRALDARALERAIEEHAWDLLVVDLRLGDGAHDGLSVLASVRALDAELPVVVVAERGDVEIARRAVAAGANDFLVRGEKLGERVATQIEKIRRLVHLLDEKRALVRENRAHREAEEARYRIVTKSPLLEKLVKAAERVGPVPRPVLILGERGTGKELFAHLVHSASRRGPHKRRGAFVAVNCAAFAEPLLESELFGHERGAYTGADKRTSGKFELAENGTLFLDEIGNTSLAFQRKILRVVEYGTYVRVGGHEELTSDARIVAATNADLEREMKEGRFLPDLYDRLAFEVIRIPPLRARPEDVEVLAVHFLERFVGEVPALRTRRLSAAAREALRRYDFPGNVRELKNVIERAVYRDDAPEIGVADLGLPLPSTHDTARFSALPFSEAVAAFEVSLLEDALATTGGNRAEAARRLGLTYDALRHQLKKHDLER